MVDLSTFTEIKKLDVVLNPTRIQADEQGNVYVVSMGNYADIPNTVQKINTETYEVTSLTNCPNATEMAYEDGKLFLFYAQWGMSSPAFLTFDTKSQSAGTSFITDVTSIQSPYSISAVGGNVYVAESDYKNNGDIYCFGGDGKLFKKFPLIEFNMPKVSRFSALIPIQWWKFVIRGIVLVCFNAIYW